MQTDQKIGLVLIFGFVILLSISITGPGLFDFKTDTNDYQHINNNYELQNEIIIESDIDKEERLESEKLEKIKLDDTRKSNTIKKEVHLQQLKLEYEKMIHELTNNERIKHGLEPLTNDNRLHKLAKSHSQDMIQNNFFDHINLDGHGPTERGKVSGVECVKHYEDGSYSYGIGENLQKLIGYNVEDVEQNSKIIVDDLMNSPGHRENILHERYSLIGVGVEFYGTMNTYTTQKFCD